MTSLLMLGAIMGGPSEQKRRHVVKSLKLSKLLLPLPLLLLQNVRIIDSAVIRQLWGYFTKFISKIVLPVPLNADVC